MTDECLENENFQNFIKAVNESYLSFDRDKELFEHSSQLNERDYAEINTKLKDEIKQRRLSVEKLIEVGFVVVCHNFGIAGWAFFTKI